MILLNNTFSAEGQGTVMTGTCLQGKISVNDKVDIATLSMERKVKSIQVFRQPVTSIHKGDRAGICVTQFDSSLVERGLVCYPGLLHSIYGCILPLNFVRFYKGSVASNSKFHIVVGHETTMAKLTCFAITQDSIPGGFSFDHEYEFCPEVNQNEMSEMKIFVLLQFEKALLAPPDCVIIGSKLDSDILTNNCRIAFYGKPSEVFFDTTYVENILPSLKVFKEKQKRGMVDRIFSEDTIICKNMLKKESNIDKFVRLKVELSTGDNGVIIGGFGQSGKIKVQLVGAPMSRYLKDSFPDVGRKGVKKAVASEDLSDVSNSTSSRTPVTVVLKFKKMLFSNSTVSKLVQ